MLRPSPDNMQAVCKKLVHSETVSENNHPIPRLLYLSGYLHTKLGDVKINRLPAVFKSGSLFTVDFRTFHVDFMLWIWEIYGFCAPLTAMQNTAFSEAYISHAHNTECSNAAEINSTIFLT